MATTNIRTLLTRGQTLSVCQWTTVPDSDAYVALVLQLPAAAFYSGTGRR